MLCFENNLVKLYCGDCLDIMSELNNKFNACITDLPYGLTNNKWDICLDLKRLWKLYEEKVEKNSAICLFSQSPFDKILGCSNLENLKFEWIWEKSKASGFLNAKKYPLKAHENILIFSYGTPKYFPQKQDGTPYNKGLIKSGNGNGSYGFCKERISINEEGNRFPRSVIRFKTAESEGKTLHPTQKPILLLEYLIKTYTQEGDLILDNCAGSGSTGIACMNTNRKCILIEKEEKYCNAIANRLEKHIIQGVLL